MLTHAYYCQPLTAPSSQQVCQDYRWRVGLVPEERPWRHRIIRSSGVWSLSVIGSHLAVVASSSQSPIKRNRVLRELISCINRPYNCRDRKQTASSAHFQSFILSSRRPDSHKLYWFLKHHHFYQRCTAHIKCPGRVDIFNTQYPSSQGLQRLSKFYETLSITQRVHSQTRTANGISGASASAVYIFRHWANV